MQFVQLVVSDEQALQTRLALDIILNDPERYVLDDEERASYEKLAVFFGHAAADPSRFPVTGKMAAQVKSIVRRAKGPAQPQSRRNKRQARQERRQSFRKRERAQRREFAEQYNAAMASLEKDREEAEAAHAEMEAQYAAEPKFDIRDPLGNVILRGVPQSALVPQDGEQAEAENIPHIIMPGSAEALGLKEIN